MLNKDRSGNTWVLDSSPVKRIASVVVVSLATQRICNDICLSRVVVNFQLVVLDQLMPSSLPHVQVRLSENVLQAVVIRIDMNHIPM
jgi:hypothetical protein